MLAEVLGTGPRWHASDGGCRLHADDVSTQKTYDPSGKVKSTEKIVTEQNSSTRGSASGVAGTSSNVGSGADQPL